MNYLVQWIGLPISIAFVAGFGLKWLLEQI